MDSLSREWNIPNLFVKRDDLTSTSIYGGNKVRKLEYLLADAKDQGCSSVWTAGGIGSHHALATSLWAREIGLRPKLLHFKQPPNEHVTETLKVLSDTQPELTLASNMFSFLARMFLRKTTDKLCLDPDTYYIPVGGSRPQGVIGYFQCAIEIERQVLNESIPEPDYILLPVGSGGTIAGLTLGLKNTDLRCKVLGVRVVSSWFVNNWIIKNLARNTQILLENNVEEQIIGIENQDFELLDQYFGPGYGEITGIDEDRYLQADELVPFELDPTYTGKAIIAIHREREKLNLTSKNLIYLHTLNNLDLSERMPSLQQSKRNLPPDYHQYLE